MSAADWTAANQRLLAAEFARLRALLANEDTARADAERRAARAALPAPAAIDRLTETFGLSAFERDVLLLCAGVEMDGPMASLCATHGATRQLFATFALALAKLPDPHWSALTPVRALRHWRLVEAHDERALTSSRLSIDERVLHYLAGVNYLEPRLAALLRAHAAPGLLGESQAVAVSALVAAHANGAEPGPAYLSGDDPAGQLEVARASAERLGLCLHVLRAADIPANRHEADALAVLWSREAMLLRSALCVQVEDAQGAGAATFAQGLRGMVVIASRHAVPSARADLRFQVDRPAAAEQKRLWETALGAHAGRLNGTLDGVAAQFRLGTDVITRTAQALRGSECTTPQLAASLWKACRDSVRVRLEDLAQRVEPLARWSDLVLPEAHLDTLRQIAVHARQRMKVYERWGFAARSARGLGISVLFTGESGTGKTMAAEVLANELHLDLYRIDLALMVSKYIGETEKNLRRVFDAAEESGAILLFDEADALFGKRSEVKDSRDRYANIEVSYLLQRMEAYHGLAILTTNLKGALDIAFQRRLRFTVQFPFPDQAQRERIWRNVFPPGAPLGPVDHALLARLNVAGGAIRNIALNAAFLAADADTRVEMKHLLQAARIEGAKRDRPFSEAETRGWA